MSDKFKALSLAPNCQDMGSTTLVLNRLQADPALLCSSEAINSNIPVGRTRSGSTTRARPSTLALAVLAASLLLAAAGYFVFTYILKLNH
jgi:hypothetical protein